MVPFYPTKSHNVVLWWITILGLAMSEVATAKIDERGRLVVPKATREALGIHGESAIVRLEIEVRERDLNSDRRDDE